MSWILTATGRAVDVALPTAGMVDIMDIAWSLSQQPRYTGHCLRPFSVAEHSLLVCEIAEREHRIDAEGLFACLMHDAHEAYCADVSTPLKRVLGNTWYALERRHEAAVAQRFDLRITLGVRQVIKAADNTALATEKRDLLPAYGAGELPWDALNGVEPVPWVNLREHHLAAHGWEFWRDRFLDRFHELDFARQLQRQGCSRHDAPAAPAGQEA